MQELPVLPRQPLVPWLAAWAVAQQRVAAVPNAPSAEAVSREVPEVVGQRGLLPAAEPLVLVVRAAARAWLPGAAVRGRALQQRVGPEAARTECLLLAPAAIPKELPSRLGFPSLRLRRRQVALRALSHRVQWPPMAMMACPRSLLPGPLARARQAWADWPD